MILHYFGAIVLTLYDNAILLISYNSNILLYLRTAKELLIWSCYDSILLLFLNNIQVDDWEGRIYLYSIDILG